MATTLYPYDTAIGKVVYRVGRPGRVGRVTEYHKRKLFKVSVTGNLQRQAFTIDWMDGTTSIEACIYFNDFMALIEDHEKKLNTHKATLAKLESMEASSGA